MNGSKPFVRVVEEVEYLLARRRRRAQERPRLTVVHGYHQPGTICVPGESIESAHLSYSEREVPVHLSLPGLVLCDCMVRHHHTPLSVARMERILAGDPFYRRLGANGFERAEETPMFTRASLRVYIPRFREQIAKALRKGGSMVLPEDALISETTDSNVVVHRINLPVEIVHRTMKLK
jgi:hypothetical protein